MHKEANNSSSSRVSTPWNHEHAIETAERVAEETGLQLKVCNVSSKLGRLRAFLKGVKITPTIILGEHRISDEITEEKILSLRT